MGVRTVLHWLIPSVAHYWCKSSPVIRWLESDSCLVLHHAVCPVGLLRGANSPGPFEQLAAFLDPLPFFESLLRSSSENDTSEKVEGSSAKIGPIQFSWSGIFACFCRVG